jgi:nicotinate-nucleotide adenylyltransferase
MQTRQEIYYYNHRKKTSNLKNHSIEYYKEFLKNRLSKKRMTHSVNVASECVKLATHYGVPPEKAEVAGLLHDICKEIPQKEQYEMVINGGFTVERAELEAKSLWHAIAGAVYVRDYFRISDPDVLNAIRFHTIGRAGMSPLEEIVYLADLISAERDFKGVSRLRRLAYSDFDIAMKESFAFALENVVAKDVALPRSTFEGYNYYIIKNS